MADRIGIRGRFIDVFVRFSDPSGEPVNADVPPSVEVTDTDGLVRQILNTAGISQIADSPGLYQFSYE
ncbi:unnamed protein product, partial [marine sediment metagenome]